LHDCLDVAWEPRFEPFYLDVGPVEVVYAPHGQEKPEVEKNCQSRGQLPVGPGAAEVRAASAAPLPAGAAIESLHGTLKAIGPSRCSTSTSKAQPIKKGRRRRVQNQDGSGDR